MRKGAVAALERGPRLGGQLDDVQVVLHDLRVARGTADSFAAAAAAQCVQRVLAACAVRLLEPVMSLRVWVPADRGAAVLADLAKRRATVLDVESRAAGAGGGDARRCIAALAPLAELGGYASTLRIVSSGAATVSMQPHGYAPMSAGEEAQAIRRAQGLE